MFDKHTVISMIENVRTAEQLLPILTWRFALFSLLVLSLNTYNFIHYLVAEIEFDIMLPETCVSFCIFVMN